MNSPSNTSRRLPTLILISICLAVADLVLAAHTVGEPCNTVDHCNGHAHSVAGYYPNCSCSCGPLWSGPFCNSCADAYSEYPACMDCNTNKYDLRFQSPNEARYCEAKACPADRCLNGGSLTANPGTLVSGSGKCQCTCVGSFGNGANPEYNCDALPHHPGAEVVTTTHKVLRLFRYDLAAAYAGRQFAYAQFCRYNTLGYNGMGGRLPSLRTSEELAAAKTLVALGASNAFPLGLSDTSLPADSAVGIPAGTTTAGTYKWLYDWHNQSTAYISGSGCQPGQEDCPWTGDSPTSGNHYVFQVATQWCDASTPPCYGSATDAVCEYDQVAATATGSNDKLFVFYAISMATQAEAQAFCRWQTHSKGNGTMVFGTIATVRSAADQDALETFDASPNSTDGRYWLGGTDAAMEGTWRWMVAADGNEGLISVGSSCQQGYCRWATDEPSSGHHELYYDKALGGWASWAGSSSDGGNDPMVVCEFDADKCSIDTHCAGRASSATGTVASGCNCACNNPYAGDGCQSCAAEYTNYPSCTVKPCTVDGSCNGVASSVSGTNEVLGCTCTCIEGYAGARCQLCIANSGPWPGCNVWGGPMQTMNAQTAADESSPVVCKVPRSDEFLLFYTTIKAGEGVAARNAYYAMSYEALSFTHHPDEVQVGVVPSNNQSSLVCDGSKDFSLSRSVAGFLSPPLTAPNPATSVQPYTPQPAKVGSAVHPDVTHHADTSTHALALVSIAPQVNADPPTERTALFWIASGAASIHGQLLDGSMAAIGTSEFTVAQEGGCSYSKVEADGSGLTARVLVAWIQTCSSSTRSIVGLTMHWRHSDTATIATPCTIAATVSSSTTHLQVALLDTADHAFVSWVDVGSNQVFGARVATGALGSSCSAEPTATALWPDNSATTMRPALSSSKTGSYVIVMWAATEGSTNVDLFYRVVDAASGALLGHVVRLRRFAAVDDTLPSITRIVGSEFAIAWRIAQDPRSSSLQLAPNTLHDPSGSAISGMLHTVSSSIIPVPVGKSFVVTSMEQSITGGFRPAFMRQGNKFLTPSQTEDGKAMFELYDGQFNFENRQIVSQFTKPGGCIAVYNTFACTAVDSTNHVHLISYSKHGTDAKTVQVSSVSGTTGTAAPGVVEWAEKSMVVAWAHNSRVTVRLISSSVSAGIEKSIDSPSCSVLLDWGLHDVIPEVNVALLLYASNCSGTMKHKAAVVYGTAPANDVFRTEQTDFAIGDRCDVGDIRRWGATATAVVSTDLTYQLARALVVWHDTDGAGQPDGSGYGIIGRFLLLDLKKGTCVADGESKVLTTATEGDQLRPHVARSGSAFILVFLSNSTTGATSFSTYFQVIDAAGELIGSSTLLTANDDERTSAAVSPHILLMQHDIFIATWQRQLSPTVTVNKAKVFRAEGWPTTPAILLSSRYIKGTQRIAQICVLPDVERVFFFLLSQHNGYNTGSAKTDDDPVVVTTDFALNPINQQQLNTFTGGQVPDDCNVLSGNRLRVGMSEHAVTSIVGRLGTTNDDGYFIGDRLEVTDVASDPRMATATVENDQTLLVWAFQEAVTTKPVEIHGQLYSSDNTPHPTMSAQNYVLASLSPVERASGYQLLTPRVASPPSGRLAVVVYEKSPGSVEAAVVDVPTMTPTGSCRVGNTVNAFLFARPQILFHPSGAYAFVLYETRDSKAGSRYDTKEFWRLKRLYVDDNGSCSVDPDLQALVMKFSLNQFQPWSMGDGYLVIGGSLQDSSSGQDKVPFYWAVSFDLTMLTEPIPLTSHAQQYIQGPTVQHLSGSLFAFEWRENALNSPRCSYAASDGTPLNLCNAVRTLSVAVPTVPTPEPQTHEPETQTPHTTAAEPSTSQPVSSSPGTTSPDHHEHQNDTAEVRQGDGTATIVIVTVSLVAALIVAAAIVLVFRRWKRLRLENQLPPPIVDEELSEWKEEPQPSLSIVVDEHQRRKRSISADDNQHSVMPSSQLPQILRVDSERTPSTPCSVSANTSQHPLSPENRERRRTKIKFKMGRLIASGGFGRVYLGLDENTGTLMAAKEIAVGAAASADVMKAVTALQKEVNMMKKLHHPNVVQYYGADKRGTNFYILMEYLPGGTLRSVVDDYQGLPLPLIAEYTKQILSGLAYIHEQGVVHRDIKAANILLSIDGVAKIGDFGSSRHFDTVTGMGGTPFWMAPEVIRGEAVSWQADIWSLGCTVMELLTGKAPFEELGTSYKVMYTLASTSDPMPIPDSITDELARSFLMACLDRDVAQRPTAMWLLQHSFLRTHSGPVAGGAQLTTQPIAGSSSTTGVTTVVASNTNSSASGEQHHSAVIAAIARRSMASTLDELHGEETPASTQTANSTLTTTTTTTISSVDTPSKESLLQKMLRVVSDGTSQYEKLEMELYSDDDDENAGEKENEAAAQQQTIFAPLPPPDAQRRDDGHDKDNILDAQEECQDTNDDDHADSSVVPARDRLGNEKEKNLLNILQVVVCSNNEHSGGGAASPEKFHVDLWKGDDDNNGAE